MRVKAWAPWLVAAVCAGPFALAWLIYFGPFDLTALPRLAGSRELVAPPVALPDALRAESPASDAPARWALIYVQTTPCARDCLETLARLYAVRLALNRDIDRVQRMLFYAGDRPRLQGDGGGLELVRLEEARDAEWLAAVGSEERLAAGRVLVADPLGNLVVSYPPDVPQKELLRDLERLLSVSQIG